MKLDSISGLVQTVAGLKARRKVRTLVDSRIREFKKAGRGTSQAIFKELCFCILTANFSAERAIRIEQEIGDGFLTLGKTQLAGKLKWLGHRYPNARASYIFAARRNYNENLKEIINSAGEAEKIREWLVKHVKGLGYKEASHFLRNIGYKNLAILDFHIIDVLVEYGLIPEKPKTLTRKQYMEIERTLKTVATETGSSLAELDLYLWYLETGKILK